MLTIQTKGKVIEKATEDYNMTIMQLLSIKSEFSLMMKFLTFDLKEIR